VRCFAEIAFDIAGAIGAIGRLPIISRGSAVSQT
jgi:hypothetical protein